MVWFGRNCEAEFRTMNELMNESITKVGIELLGQLKTKKLESFLTLRMRPKLLSMNIKANLTIFGCMYS